MVYQLDVYFSEANMNDICIFSFMYMNVDT